MASLKKSFRRELSLLEQSASDLLLLVEGMSALESVQALAKSVLQACELLSRQAKQLHKKDFAEQIMLESSLFELDELVDRDVISIVEERISAGLGCQHNAVVGELLQQLLEKLEKQVQVLSEQIQQLVGLLNREA